MAVAIFDHDDCRIDQYANCEGQTSERHDVGADTQQVDRDEGDENSNGQRQYRYQCGAEIEKKDHDDQAHDDGLFHQIMLKRGN